MDTSTQVALDKILNATSPVHVFKNIENGWKDEYKYYVGLVHPDKCDHPRAHEAVSKLNKYKQELERGIDITDESGTGRYFVKQLILKDTDYRLREVSFNNYRTLMDLKSEASKELKKYLPENMEFQKDMLTISFRNRAIPLSSLETLPQEHVNWVLSRMIEFVGYMSMEGYVHAGINPDSIFIMPESHGLVCTSFYHMVRKGTRLQTVSGKWKSFYPEMTFSKKRAVPAIDLELAKRTAVWLAGDKRGCGTILRKTHNEELVDFLMKFDSEPYLCFTNYRRLLSKHFDTSKFIPLNI